MLAVFSTQLNCSAPDCLIEMRVAAASVRVQIIATILNPTDDASDLLIANSDRLAAMSIGELSGLIQWRVEESISHTITVASSPPAPYPGQPPLVMITSAQATETEPTVRSSAVAILVCAIVAILLVVGCAATTYWYRSARAAEEKSRKSQLERYQSAIADDATGDVQDDTGAFTMTPRGSDDEVKSAAARVQAHAHVAEPESPPIDLSLRSSTRDSVAEAPSPDGSSPFAQAPATEMDSVDSVAPPPLVQAAAAAAANTAAMRTSASAASLHSSTSAASLHSSPSASSLHSSPSNSRLRSISRQQRRMPSHRPPPLRSTQDVLADVMPDSTVYRDASHQGSSDVAGACTSGALPRHRSPPKRTTAEAATEVMGNNPRSPTMHRPAPKRRAPSPLDAELSLARPASKDKLPTRQYRPAPVRTVITPGLPPLGAGALQVDYRPPPTPSSQGDSSSDAGSPPQIQTYRPPPMRSSPPAGVEVEPEIIEEARIGLEILQEEEEGPPAREALQRSKMTRREARKDRRAGTRGAVEQYL